MILYTLLKNFIVIILSIVVIFSVSKPKEQIKPYNKQITVETEKVNKYPIVLVHGFFGYGRNDKKNDYYWGREYGDIEQIFKKAGFNVMTAVVSPFSSNWHRACELYAYIKGGRVDYGAKKSKELGHERYGREFEGIYKDWDNDHPIHIIAHSQGGQTSRLLSHFLEYGDDTEKNSTTDHSELFDGNKGKSLISLTTLATPHDGTTAVTNIDKITKNNTYKLIPFLALLNMDAKKQLLDYQLEYWSLKRKNGESLFKYLNRIEKNKAFKRKEGFALYDLSPEGAAKLNGYIKDSPNTYYLSVALKASNITFSRYKYSYNIDVLNVIEPSSLKGCKDVFRGVQISNNKYIKENGFLYFDSDGVVNTYSATGPHINSNSIILTTDNNDTLEKGKWNNLKTIEASHSQIIGSKIGYNNIDLTHFYNNLFYNISEMEKNYDNNSYNVVYKDYFNIN